MSYIGKQPTKAPLTASDIEDGIITAAKIEDGAVVAAEIASNAVTTAKINADAVTGAKIADDAINSEHYTDGSVDTAHIADANVTTAKIADDAITAAKINNDIISGTTALTSEPADTDEFLVSDAGTLKRIDYSLIKGGGITEADNWRMSADFAGKGHITSNWERNDNLSSYIGSGMSESSGTFTFPSTGIYLVNAQSYIDATSGVAEYMGLRIFASNDGTNFNAITQNYDSSSTDNFHGSIFCSALFDVTNTSNNKIRLYTDHSRAASEVTYAGNTSINYTALTFIRLGDT